MERPVQGIDVPDADNRAEAGSGSSTGHDSLQMPPELMLDLAHKVVEILVKRNEQLAEGDAWDGEFRQDLDERFMALPPEKGRPAEDVIETAARDILPLALRLDHPRSFGFIPSSTTWPGVLADFMAAAHNINQCTWLVASGASQIELVVIDWFRSWLGYPESAGGLMTSGASAASVDAFVAAREAAGDPEGATVYVSDQGHGALTRAATIVGVRPENVRTIPTDSCARLRMDALKRVVADDRAAGLNPVAIVANAGTGSTGAIDPLEGMADFCETEDVWFHVDAAYGGFAILTERGRRVLRGIERADSIGLDAHKWLFQPYEAGCLMVKDAATLENAFSLHHDMLQDTIWGANHPNFSDRGLQLSRSTRALKVWMSIQTFGMAAFRRAVAKSMDLAARAGEYVQQSPTLELLQPVSLSIVCFRVNPADSRLDEESLDKINKIVLARMFWDDPALMTSTLVSGRTLALRLCIVNHTTTWDDVRETLDAVATFGRNTLADSES